MATMNEQVIYMDNNATSQVAPEVVDAMLPFFPKRMGILQVCIPLAAR